MSSLRTIAIATVCALLGGVAVAVATQTNYLGTVFIADTTTPTNQLAVNSDGSINAKVSGTVSPGGPAGGDLGGTYPNPTVTGIDAGGATTSITNGATDTYLTDVGGYVNHVTPTCANAAMLGFVGDGITNNDTAFNTWASSLSSYGYCIQFGAGKFLFSSAHTVTIPGSTGSTNAVSIFGAGSNLTTLYFPTTAGITIAEASQQHSFHVRNLSITTGTTNAGTALAITNSVAWGGTYAAMSDVTRVTFRGDDGNGVTDYWTTAFSDSNVSNVEFAENTIYFDTAAAPTYHGTGIALSSAGTSCFLGGACLIGFNITGGSINFANVGLSVGTNVENVTDTAGSIWNGTTGVLVTSGNTGNSNLSFTNVQFGTHGIGLDMETAMPYLSVSGGQCQAGSSQTCFKLAHYAGGTIVGVNFSPYVSTDTPTAAIEVGSLDIAGYPTSISANSIISFGTGVLLDSGSSLVTVAGDNSFNNNTANFTDNGSGNIILVPTTLTNSLSGDVSMSSANTFFTGPTVAQGTKGTWLATGSVVLTDSAEAAALVCKLWDGTTVIASMIVTQPAAGDAAGMALSGVISAPAGNIRISCENQSGTTGKIKSNLSGGNADSVLSVVRIK